MKIIFYILVIWFLVHYGILSAFLMFCANVFAMVAGWVA
jgi:hypothetical protein